MTERAPRRCEEGMTSKIPEDILQLIRDRVDAISEGTEFSLTSFSFEVSIRRTVDGHHTVPVVRIHVEMAYPPPKD